MKTVSLTEALRSGKKWKYRGCNGRWYAPSNEALSNDFAWATHDILTLECQIEQEPRVIWVNEYKNDLGSSVYETKEDAMYLVDTDNYIRTVKFVEALDE